MEKKFCNLQVKEFHSEERTLSGYASTFGFPADSHGDVIARGAFVDCVKKIEREGIPLLDSHKQDSEHVLGTVVSAYEEEHGLFIKAKLADTPRVEEIRQKLKQGHIKKMSIGFFIEAQSFTQQDGMEYRVIEKADLIEVSVVPIPANGRATILAVKQQELDNTEETESPKIESAEAECTECACQKDQDDGVRAEKATENAESCETPKVASDEEVQSLERLSKLLGMSINETRRKYNGK